MSNDFTYTKKLNVQAATLTTTGAATIGGNLAVTGSTTFTGPVTVPGAPLMTVNPDLAATGSTVTDAAQIVGGGLTVVTGADGTKGVKLPAAPTPGTTVYIKGTAAAVLKVWPDPAATINAIGSNGALSLASGAIPAIFIAKSATQWYSFPLVPS
jgi:hypothetical protein